MSSYPVSFVAPRQRSHSRGSYSGSPSPYGTSPTSTSPLTANTFGTSPSSAPHPRAQLLGTSPTASRTTSAEKYTSYVGAKKWWKRLQYDTELDPDAFVVGYIESVEHPERRSGAEAWSMRVHHRLVEATYPDFTSRFSSGDVPFHRIAYFRNGPAVVWESEQHKRQQAAAAGDQSPSGQAGADAFRLSPSATPPPGAHSNCNTDDSDEYLASGMQGLFPFIEDDYCDGVDAAQGQAPPVEELRSFSDLPNECWHNILSRLCVRDLCVSARLNRCLRELVADPALWLAAHAAIFGAPPPPVLPPAAVRRLCRRSELRAARWLDAEASEQLLGPAGTRCLQLDDTKVVSADGTAVRLWSHATGRRLATLQSHTGTVTGVAFDEDLLVSGDCQGVVKVWRMDDLRGVRTLRGDQVGAVTCCGLLGGMPVSGAADGSVRLWDLQSQHPVVVLEAAGTVRALDPHHAAGYLVTAGQEVELWDLSTAQKLHVLDRAPLDAAWQGVSEEAISEHLVFNSVSYSGNLLAAGCAAGVAVWDARTQQAIVALQHAAAVGTPTAASFACAATGGCVGVQLDEWKLAVATGGRSGGLAVFDMRAAGAHGWQGPGSWSEAVLQLSTPAPITCFQFHGQRLLAGLDGMECMLWDFHAPSRGVTGGDLGPVGEALGAGAEGGGPPWGATSAEKKGRKKGVKAYKKEGKFPKRKHK